MKKKRKINKKRSHSHNPFSHYLHILCRILWIPNNNNKKNNSRIRIPGRYLMSLMSYNLNVVNSLIIYVSSSFSENKEENEKYVFMCHTRRMIPMKYLLNHKQTKKKKMKRISVSNFVSGQINFNRLDHICIRCKRPLFYRC